MKTLITSIGTIIVWCVLTVAPNPLFGQTESTTTTVTSTGTVSDWSPNAVAVKVDTSPTPIRYTFTKTTTYVDENGNPVSVETVRDGAPVTVYYQKEGDSFVADKVVVKKTVTTTDATIPAAPPAAPPTTVSQVPAPPSADGVVTDADSDDIMVRTAASPSPVHYKAHDSTAYVDASGNPVSRKSLTPGTPVTVFYEQRDDGAWATRVVIKNPDSLNQQTTTTTRETTMPSQ